MRNKRIKILILFLFVFMLTGCTKLLTDENKKPVKYESKLICDFCNSKCEKLEEELKTHKSTCKVDEESEEETCDVSEDEINKLKEDIFNCKKNCNDKCVLAKKNETGQNLTKNILCRPTNADVLEIYEMNKVDLNELPSCQDFKLFSNYEGLWISIFVKPLAWLIIKLGVILKNYGLSLVLISIAIRAVLMPLTKKTAMQSENLKKAQPELDRINKKYENKSDNDSLMKKNEELLMVYKKYKINPLSSCLFAFIQIPLLFAFIEAINRTPAIFEGSFLGLHLGVTPWTALKSGQWWYLIIVVILALVTYYSLNMNKGASAGGMDTEKQMQMMSKIMLVFIVYASFTLSTAICMYWIASSAFTIFQNILVKRVK